jgi:tryptophanyl-tRNA synthetase
MEKYTLEAAKDFIALGLDFKTHHFWVQSDVPEVTELTWYLSNMTPVGLLQRCHAYKEKVDKGLPANNGLFTYPVLMAADILAYNCNKVPVGQDQKQHVEVARDLAIKFNNTYGELFTVPEPEIKNEVAVVPGTDGKKMSKSYGNTIEIFGNEQQVRKTIMKIVTDSTPVEKPKDTKNCTVFNLYKLFASGPQIKEMEENYSQGGYGYGSAKKALADLLIGYFFPYREKRAQLDSHPDDVRDILKSGRDKTRAIVIETLEKVRHAVGVVY